MLDREIVIDRFRQVLFFPLILPHPALSDDDSAPSDRVGAIIRKFAPRWELCADPLDHIGGRRCDQYAEFVYFHEFIQNFLFRRTAAADAAPPEDAGDWSMYLFRRNEDRPAKIRARFRRFDEKHPDDDGNYDFSIRLSVERLNLYVFSSGVAILAIELLAKGDCVVSHLSGTDQPEVLGLDHAIAVQNALRRVYPPYFKESGNNAGELIVPEYPVDIEMTDDRSRPLFPRPQGDGDHVSRANAAEFIDFVVNETFPRRLNPIAPHWRWLLEPLELEGYPADNDAGRSGYEWRQIVDERLPSMLFIVPVSGSVANWDKSDWVRLCFADEPGRDSPYAGDFLQTFEADHCYDRFWWKQYGTRYTLSGYSFAMITTPHDGFENVLEMHFRRHYFQFGLLNYFQFAALLAMSNWISESVHKFELTNRQQLRGITQELHGHFLSFVQRYWFTNVSNQMQGRELYGMWRGKLGTEAIYREVAEQLQVTSSYLDAKEQAFQSASAWRLSVVATFGLAASVAAGVLGMNLVIDKAMISTLISSAPPAEAQEKALGAGYQFAIVFSVFATTLLASFLVLQYVRKLERPHGPLRASRENGPVTRDRKIEQVFFAGALILFALAALSGTFFSWYWPS